LANFDKWYRILGVSPSTSKDDLKKEFKKLALKYHPDRGGNEDKFKEVNKAYGIITGKVQLSRQEVKEEAAEKIKQQQSSHESRWAREEEEFWQPKKKPAPKRQLKYVVREYDKYDNCTYCKGVPKITAECKLCFGTGNIVGMQHDGDVYVRSCKECNSAGQKILFICKHCQGYGRVAAGKQQVGSWE
jgi:DnaJ-class molecular chaperone